MIVPDSREPHDFILPLTDACTAKRIEVGAPVAHDSGDFWLMPQGGTFTIVERKKAQDFSNSIVDGRLFKQIGRCLEVARGVNGRVVLLYEGVKDMFAAQSAITIVHRPGLHPNSLRGALLSLQDEGVTLVPTRNGDDTIKALIWLYELAIREGKNGGRKSVSSRKAHGDRTEHALGSAATREVPPQRDIPNLHHNIRTG